MRRFSSLLPAACAPTTSSWRGCTTGTSATSTASSATTSTPPAPRRGFNATVNFALRDDQLTSDNLPSAAELRKILPTAKEIRADLPDHKDISERYQLDRPGAGRAPPMPDYLVRATSLTGGGGGKPTGRFASVTQFFSFFKHDNNSPHAMTAAAGAAPTDAMAGQHPDDAPPAWPDCDTVEDIINEEKFGGDVAGAGEEVSEGGAAAAGEHFLLAIKALLYGSVIAAAFTAAFSLAIGRYFFGFRSWQELTGFLRDRDSREMARLSKASKAAGGDGEVVQMTFDLTQPGEMFTQAEAIFTALQELAEAEAAAEEEAKTAVADTPSAHYKL